MEHRGAARRQGARERGRVPHRGRDPRGCRRKPEQLLAADEESEAARAKAAQELDELKARFAENGDEVNLAWIGYSLDGIDDLAEMARLSGWKVQEFYRARDRRVRLVQRMLTEKK